MQVPSGGERFTFPNPQAPNSPPSTPESASSFQDQPPAYTPTVTNKRHGFIGPLLSPPEHIAPTNGHKFSYNPSQREDSSDTDTDSDESEMDTDVDQSSSEEEEGGSDDEIEAPEAPEAPTVPFSHEPFHSSITIESVTESFELSIEEITEDDIGYGSDTEVVHPTFFEEASSEADEDDIARTVSDYDLSSESDSDDSLLNEMESCRIVRDEIRQFEREFEEKQRQKYLRKKKRWSKGGNHKRSIAESIGSDSDNEDIMPLEDADVMGSSARRLRRRTEGPDGRPRRSLLFEDPPKEIEELKYLEADGEVLASDDEIMLPPWMYVITMEVDSEEDANVPVIKPTRRSRRR